MMTLEEAKQKAMVEAAAEGQPEVENEEVTEQIPSVEESAVETAEPMEEQAENPQQEAAKPGVQPMDQQAAITERAVQAAEQATMQMRQMQAQIQQMQEQNQHFQETIRQMSEQHEEAAIETAMQNQMPQLDIASLAFDDADTAAQKQTEYAQQMSQYVRGEIMKELEPYIAQTKAGLEAREIDSVIGNIEQTPELSHIREIQPQLEQIIKNNKVIANSDASMEDKLIMAYAIAKGVDVIQNPPKKPTADELFSMYQEDADFRKLVEQDRLKKIKSQPSVPPLSAGGGAGNAALNIPDKPKTLEEARKMAMKNYF